jgi:hypothetical protein
MIARRVRIGKIEDQDQFRRADLLAMTPEERIMTLIRLRNRQIGAVSQPVRDSGVVSYRRLDPPNASRRSLLQAKAEAGRPKDLIDYEELIAIAEE